MEDTLGAINQHVKELYKRVLILVLMEDTLGGGQDPVTRALCKVVLILVLMEDTLGAKAFLPDRNNLRSLNPCFNGRYSWSITNLFINLLNSIKS